MDLKKYRQIDPSAFQRVTVHVEPGPICDINTTATKVIGKEYVGYESGFRIINRTNTTLYVQDRTGPVTAVPVCSFGTKTNNSHISHRTLDFPASPDLHVQTGFISVLWYHTAAYTEMLKLAAHYEQYAAHSDVWRKIAKNIRAALNDPFVRANVICTLVVTASIEATELNHDTPTFIPEFGVVIGDTANRDKIYNPWNLEELVRYNAGYVENGVVTRDDPAFFRMVAYTTVPGRYDRLFVRVMDTVQEVPVLYDDTGERNGIEVYEKRPIDRQGQPVDQGLVFYTFEEAFEKFELATSIDGAYRVREEKVKELKLEAEIRDSKLKVQTLEFQHAKLLNDKEEAEIKFQRETEKYNRELEKLSKEKEMLTLKYEQEQQTRLESIRQRDKQAGLDFTKGFMGFVGQTLSLVLQLVKALPTNPA